MNYKYLGICATHGRHECLERAVGMFLNNDYENKHLLIFNNSTTKQKLNKEYENIILINQSVNTWGDKFTSLGDIYNTILNTISELGIQPDVVSMWDDDDMYLPNHISEGVKGWSEAHSLGKEAYKPKQSYYRHAGGVESMENTLEPSIFVSYEHMNKYGFSDETTAQHLAWVNPLVYEGKILVKSDGIKTLIYNWGPDVPTFKTSGDPHNPNNFNNFRSFSQSEGNGTIHPYTKQQLERYFNFLS